MTVIQMEKNKIDFNNVLSQYVHRIDMILVLPRMASFIIIMTMPAMELTMTKAYRPPPISKHVVIKTTIITLCKRSQDLSCMNFSYAVIMPFKGMKGKDITQNREAIIYTILNLSMSSGLKP